METYVKFTRFQFLLYYFANFIGLAPFSLVNNKVCPAGFWRKIYALILVVLSSLWTYITFVYNRPKFMQSNSVHDFAFAIHVTLFIGDISSSLLILAFKSNTIIEIMNKITAIRDQLNDLKIRDNSDKKNNVLFYAKLIATNSAVLLFRIGIDITLENGQNGKSYTALFWIGSLLVSVHSHNAILIFVETINHLRQLFESLNNKLQGTGHIFLPSRNQGNSPAFRISTQRRIAIQEAPRITNKFETIHLSVGDVKKLKKIHGEICELVESVTNIYTIALTFAILQQFSRLLTNFYSLYTRVYSSRYSDEIKETLVPFVQQMSCRTAISTLELFLIANACTSIRKVVRGNATKTVLHRLWNKFYPEELQDEFFKFSLQLMQKPVVVSAFGFFRLDYSYLYKIFCAVVGYFLIMIQFDTSQPNTDV